MKKLWFYLVIVLFCLAVALAQGEEICFSDNDCPDLTTYCNIDTGFCEPLQKSTPVVSTPSASSMPKTTLTTPVVAKPVPAAAPLPAVSAAEITNLKLQVNSLETTLTNVQTKVNSLESTGLNIEQKLMDLEGKINSFSSKLEEVKAVRKDVGTISTGMAFLQKDLNKTSTEVNLIQSDLEKRAARTKFLTYIFVILLIIASFLFVYYYITRQGKAETDLKTTKALPENVYHYISRQIKSGQKHSEIKLKLVKTGWSEDEAEWALKETGKRNYETYQRQKGAVSRETAFSTQSAQPRKEITTPTGKTEKPRETKGMDAEKKKIIAISVVSIIILIVVFFILRASIGQAVYYEQKINASTSTRGSTTEGAIYYEFKCTPPHILTLTKDGCCLDHNNNEICDYIETEEVELKLEQVAEKEKCFDNRQCNQGSMCMNGFCLPLYSLYEGKGDCSRLCNYYSVQVSTSDGEVYTVKPGEGSYTGAGALEWKIMSAPDHCKGEPAKVPINIIRKRPGKIINEDVIVLSKGQSSQPLTHQYLPKLSFTLTLNQVHELCPEI